MKNSNTAIKKKMGPYIDSHSSANADSLVGKIKIIGFWILFFFTQILTCSLLSWELGTGVNFGYSLGYEWLDINKHIQTYAPQNSTKPDFSYTGKNEHIEFFKQTVSAINHDGAGLDSITYELPNRNKLPLYTPAEVTHLKDVAHLIQHFFFLAIACVLVWLFCLWYIKKFRKEFPKVQHIALGLLSIIGVSGLVILLLGPTDVFYWLHTQIFPKGHQWYFFYQESLMATYMKAPELFGFIAILLLIFFICFFTTTSFIAKRMTHSKKEIGNLSGQST